MWALSWAERLRFAPAAPTAMVALRIGLYGALAVWALSVRPVAAAQTAALYWEPRSVLQLLPGPPAAGLVVAAQVLLVLAALAAALGLWGRVAQLVVVPPLVLVAGLLDAVLGTLSHRTSLAVVLAVALAPAPLAAHWSLDRWRARRRGAADPPWISGRWAWPVGLAQLVVVLVYVSSGLAKVRFGGLAWLRPESFQRWTYVKLDRMAEPSTIGLWIAEHPALAAASAAGILVIQLSVAAVLVWPRFRPLAVAGILTFHIVSWLALDLQFLLMAAIAWLPLVDWEGWRARVGWPPAAGHRPGVTVTQKRPGRARRSARSGSP